MSRNDSDVSEKIEDGTAVRLKEARKPGVTDGPT
jgi:hypothetical protein